MPSFQLTPHFTLAELVVTDHREYLAQQQNPPDRVVDQLRKTAELAEVVRSFVGNQPLLITSGWRCPDLNRAVGGAANSAHMWGGAIDFTCPSFGTPEMLWLAIKDSGIVFDQLILEFGVWVHLGRCLEGVAPRRMAFRIGC